MSRTDPGYADPGYATTLRQISERELSLAPMVINTLRECKFTAPPSDLNLVFPTGKVTVMGLQRIIDAGFHRLQRKAGLQDETGKPHYVVVHTLRHFYANWLINAGFQPKRVQALIGHSSVTITLDTHSNLWPDEQMQDNSNLWPGEQMQVKLAAGELAVIG